MVHSLIKHLKDAHSLATKRLKQTNADVWHGGDPTAEQLTNPLLTRAAPSPNQQKSARQQRRRNQVLLDFTLKCFKRESICATSSEKLNAELCKPETGRRTKIRRQKSIYSRNISSRVRLQAEETQWFLLLWQPQQTTSGTEQEGEGERKNQKKKKALLSVGSMQLNAARGATFSLQRKQQRSQMKPR